MSNEVPISPQCRGLHHKSCTRKPEDCDCECHDDEDETPATAARRDETLSPHFVRAAVDAMAPQPAAVASITDPIRCRVADCKHKPFSTLTGERVHHARVHGPRADAYPTPDPAPEDHVPDRPDPDGQLPHPSPLVADVAEALSYLEGLDPVETIAMALD